MFTETVIANIRYDSRTGMSDVPFRTAPPIIVGFLVVVVVDAEIQSDCPPFSVYRLLRCALMLYGARN